MDSLACDSLTHTKFTTHKTVARQQGQELFQKYKTWLLKGHERRNDQEEQHPQTGREAEAAGSTSVLSFGIITITKGQGQQTSTRVNGQLGQD